MYSLNDTQQSKIMTISLEYLEDIKESGKLTKITQELVTIIVLAMNDWPSEVLSLADFETKIYTSIGEDLDKEKIEEYLINVDFTLNSWKAESICQLLEIYNYYDEGRTLKEIMKEIRDDLKVTFEKMVPTPKNSL